MSFSGSCASRYRISADQVGDVLVDLLAEEHDPLLEQHRVDVEGPVATRRLLDDGRDEGLVQHRASSSMAAPPGCAEPWWLYRIRDTINEIAASVRENRSR